MSNRISRDELNSGILKLIEKRSTCERKSVGALLTIDNRIIATGYNGPPMDFPHCKEAGCDTSEKCKNSTHAEVNCIAFAARHGISTEGATLWVSLSPCAECCKIIINSGIKEVNFLELYRINDHLKDYSNHVHFRQII